MFYYLKLQQTRNILIIVNTEFQKAIKHIACIIVMEKETYVKKYTDAALFKTVD